MATKKQTGLKQLVAQIQTWAATFTADGCTREILPGTIITGPNNYDRIMTDSRDWQLYGGDNVLAVTLTRPGADGKPDAILAVNLNVIQERDPYSSRRSARPRVYAEGHTYFTTPRGWSSFDRIGVESSFSPIDWTTDTLRDAGSIIAEQFARIARVREVDLTRIDVPGDLSGWRITPDRKAQVTAQLKAGKLAMFTPSGFGTGYYLSAKPLRHGREVAPTLAAFFGFSTLYIESFDHD